MYNDNNATKVYKNYIICDEMALASFLNIISTVLRLCPTAASEQTLRLEIGRPSFNF
jgi:hypothetical protein